MKVKYLAVVSLLAALTTVGDVSARNLDAQVAYSYDGGKTWGGGQPTVREGQTFRMRVAYAFSDPRDDRDVVTASLTSAEKFASITKALPDGTFQQREPIYWRSSKVNGAYNWEIDPTGLKPGTHLVRLNIGYWVKKPVRELVRDDQVVYLTVVGKMREDEAEKK